MNPGMNKKE